jgi:tetratricopeptide (TPR) repeat protein
VKTEQELSGAALDLWKRGKAAADSNNRDYAVQLFADLLKREPSFLGGRQLLRAVEIQRFKAQSALSRQLGGVKTAGAAMKAAGALKKNPSEALVLAEEVLAADPYNAKGNEVLGEAAQALGLPEIAILARETIADANPNDKKNLHTLAQLCLKLSDFNRAISVFERILAIDPRDGDAQSGMKNATAQLASSTGGWEKGGDFRDSLANKDQAIQLEQQQKVANTADAIAEQIERLSHQVSAHPNNLVYPKQIADLYLKQEDYENAIVWYTYTFEQSGKTDASLEKTIGNLQIKKVDHDIANARANAEASAADPEVQQQWNDYLAQLVTYRKQLALETAQARVQRYPNDKQFHYELGRAYVDLAMYKEARPALQEGKRQPSVRFEASNLLGICFWKSNMFDLAEKELSSSAGEIPIMNDLKKEILYNLGCVRDDAGKKPEAIEVFKQIYEVDLGYKDVAARVEGSYGG